MPAKKPTPSHVKSVEPIAPVAPVEPVNPVMPEKPIISVPPQQMGKGDERTWALYPI